MTAQYRQWLPEGAIEHSHIAGEFDAQVLDWAENWGPSLKPAPLVFGAPGSEARKPKGETARLEYAYTFTEFGIGRSADTMQDLGLALIGADGKNLHISQYDKPVLQKLGQTAFDDLQERITAIVKPCAGQGDIRDRFFENPSISDEVPQDFQVGEILLAGGTIRIGIALHENIFVRHRKMKLPAAKSGSVASDRMLALGKSGINIKTRIGTATLTIADVKTLVPGDVLELDRKLDELTDLMINDRLTLQQVFRLRQGGEKLQFEIR